MDLFFYLFSSIIILSALGVVSSTNPVYSVLWLIFTFLNSSGIFILLGAEFIAMTIVIVYVGAVAVLFLFVVMMLHVDQETVKRQFLSNRIISTSLMMILIIDIFLILNSAFSKGYSITSLASPYDGSVSNTHALGNIIYTDYIISFQISGLILLVAMVGAIVLTLRKRDGVRRQNVQKQNLTDPENSIKIVKVKFKEGVSGISYK
jgi:NADH-quinone oxidoreductase subunit J